MHSSYKTVLFTLLTITVLALVLGSNEPVKAEGETVVNVKAKDKTEAVSKDESEVTQSDSEGDAGTKEDAAETENKDSGSAVSENDAAENTNDGSDEETEIIKDITGPTIQAAVNEGVLTVTASDGESEIEAVYINGHEYTGLTNGKVGIRLQQFDNGYKQFNIQAKDTAGNMSDIYSVVNPYFDDGTKENPIILPDNVRPTDPGSAVGTVTDHVYTGVDGTTWNADNPPVTEGGMVQELPDIGREFYTIKTESGKVFYLIIDRDSRSEEVYFLTEITERDLLNTTSGNSETLPQNSAVVTGTTPVKNVNESGKTVSDNRNPQTGNEDPEAKPKDDPTKMYIIMGAVAVVAILFGFYSKVIKKKKNSFSEDDDDDDNDSQDYHYVREQTDPDDIYLSSGVPKDGDEE